MNTIIGSAGLKLAYVYLNSSPEKNIPKLMDWMDRLVLHFVIRATTPRLSVARNLSNF